jgi:hypothetical protein
VDPVLYSKRAARDVRVAQPFGLVAKRRNDEGVEVITYAPTAQYNLSVASLRR